MASTGNHGSGASSDEYSGRRTDGGRGLSSAVYRRRRLAVVILVLVAVVALAAGALVLAGVFRPDGDPEAQSTTSASSEPAESNEAQTDTPTATATPTPSSGTSPSASASPSTSGTSATPAEGCAVVVAAETDEPVYSAGEEPILSLVVRNEGDEPCELNLGTSQMEFVLTSEDERVFSSVDCQADSQDLERTIEPGGEERATFTWSRNRTVPDCSVVEEEPAPGEYTLITRLGARSSAPVEFTLE